MTRIRTRADDDTYNDISPCGYAEETQDYTLNIIEAPNVVPPTNLIAVLKDSTSVELIWNDNSLHEDFHYIYRGEDGNTFEHIGSVESNITEYLDEGLDKGTEYYYKISAVSGTLSSDFSETITISTPLDPTLILSTENIVKPTVSVYPNPAIEYIILDNQNSSIVEATIHDLNGRIIGQFKIHSQNEKLNISNLKSGIYVMKISSFDTEKLVKIIKR